MIDFGYLFASSLSGAKSAWDEAESFHRSLDRMTPEKRAAAIASREERQRAELEERRHKETLRAIRDTGFWSYWT